MRFHLLQSNFPMTSSEVRRLALSTFKVQGMHCEMHSTQLIVKEGEVERLLSVIAMLLQFSPDELHLMPENVGENYFLKSENVAKNYPEDISHPSPCEVPLVNVLVMICDLHKTCKNEAIQSPIVS